MIIVKNFFCHCRNIRPVERYRRSSASSSCLQYKSLKNTVGKGEIAHNEQFLLFSQFFSTCLKSFLPFSTILKFLSANSFNLLFGKGLKLISLTNKRFDSTQIYTVIDIEVVKQTGLGMVYRDAFL